MEDSSGWRAIIILNIVGFSATYHHLMLSYLYVQIYTAPCNILLWATESQLSTHLSLPETISEFKLKTQECCCKQLLSQQTRQPEDMWNTFHHAENRAQRRLCQRWGNPEHLIEEYEWNEKVIEISKVTYVIPSDWLTDEYFWWSGKAVIAIQVDSNDNRKQREMVCNQ